MSKRSCLVFRLSEKIDVLNVIRKEHILYAKVGKLYIKNKFSDKLWKRKRKYMPVLLSHLILQKSWLQGGLND
jgi:hypothetical protein